MIQQIFGIGMPFVCVCVCVCVYIYIYIYMLTIHTLSKHAKGDFEKPLLTNDTPCPLLKPIHLKKYSKNQIFQVCTT